MEMGMIYTLETFMYVQGTKKEEIKSQVQEVMLWPSLSYIMFFTLSYSKVPKTKHACPYAM